MKNKIIITTLGLIALLGFALTAYALSLPSERDLQNQRLGQIQQAQQMLNEANEEMRAKMDKNSNLWNALNKERQGIEEQLGFTTEQ